MIANSAATDVDVVLSPKGTGSLAAQLADDALTGGEKRGQYAVDWQMERTNTNMVAAGHYSVISGGFNNSVRGFAGTVAGGSDNSVGFDVTNSAVLGGMGNSVGGIETAGNYSSIVGGINNAVTGNYSVVLGGSGLNLSGARSFGFNANLDGNGSETRNMAVSNDNTAVFGNVDLWLANNDNVTRSLRFYEQYDTPNDFPNGTNFVGFRAPNSIADNVTWTLPDADGTAGQVLSTDASGGLSWASVGDASSLTELTGDVTTAAGPGSVLATVARIQGNAVSSAAPNDGDALTWSATNTQWEPQPIGGTVPCGGIIMWSGDINNVPSGWALCDGQNGTPNLNDRFPRGTTSSGNLGITGGNDTHSHTVDDHSHTISGITGSGSGTATFGGTTDNATTGLTASLSSGSDVTTSADGSNNTLSSSVDITDNGHSHSVSGSSNDVSVTVNVSGSTDNSNGVGTSQADNVPAYVYVGFIIRVCTP